MLAIASNFQIQCLVNSVHLIKIFVLFKCISFNDAVFAIQISFLHCLKVHLMSIIVKGGYCILNFLIHIASLYKIRSFSTSNEVTLESTWLHTYDWDIICFFFQSDFSVKVKCTSILADVYLKSHQISLEISRPEKVEPAESRIDGKTKKSQGKIRVSKSKTFLLKLISNFFEILNPWQP